MDNNIGESTDSQSALGQVAIPYVTDLRQEIINNTLFYTTKWTSRNMQFALISVPPNSETGLDVHYYSDQFFYVERVMLWSSYVPAMIALTFSHRYTMVTG